MANKSLCDFDVDGELKATSLDINGAADISGTITTATWGGNVISQTYGGTGAVTGTRTINSSAYTMIGTVAGDRLASIVEMTLTGTSNSVVIAASFEITVQHSQDIFVKSMNGDYKDVKIKITSNNNEDFSIEAMHSTSGLTDTPMEVWLYPKAGETCVITATDPGYSGLEYEHIATEGTVFGANDNSNAGHKVSIIGEVEATSLDINGNADISGNLTGVDAFTASGKITGAELEGTSLDINGNADISGNLTGVDAFTASGKIQGAELEGTSLDINGNADISGNLTGVDAFTASGKIQGAELEGTSLDINGRVDFQTISTSGDGTIVRGGFLNPAAEASMVHIPHLINDLAGFQKWSNSTITVTGLYKTRGGSSGSYSYSNAVAESDFSGGQAFDAHSSTAGSWYSDNGADGSTAGVGVITLEWPNELTYSAWAGIVFGSGSFTAPRVKIEAYQTDAGWQTLCDISDNSSNVVLRQISGNSGGGQATKKLRYTLGGSVNNSYFRIHTLYAANYRAGDNSLNNTSTAHTQGVNFLEKYKDGYLHGHLYPGTDDTYDLGSTSYQWKNGYFDGTVNADGLDVGGNIAASGTITGTTLTGTSLDINGNADISGDLTMSGHKMVKFSSTTYGAFDSEDFFRIKFQDFGGVHNDVGIGQTATGMLGFNASPDKSFLFNLGTQGNVLTLSNGQATFDGEVEAASLDINGNADISGTLSGNFVVRSTNNANTSGANFNVNTTNKAVDEYAYEVQRSGTTVAGVTIGGDVRGARFIIGGHVIDDIDVAGEFEDSAAHLLTSAAALDKFHVLNANTTGTAAGLSATLAINKGGTAATNSNGWLNSRITTSADGSLNYDATSAVAVNHDSLAGFEAAEHVNWAADGAGAIHASNYVENVVGNLGVTANGTSLTVTTTNGSNQALPAATTSAWGVMTDEMVTSLNANTAKDTNVETPDAEEGTKGKVALATVEEAQEGTDTEKAITAAGLSARASDVALSKKIHELTPPTSALAMNSQKITGVTDPTAAQDAATKAYTDAKTWNGNDITAGTIAAARIPTLNQNTTGSAGAATTADTLRVPRAINGVDFDGSAAITIKASACFEFRGYGTSDGTNYETSELMTVNTAPFEHDTSTGSDGLTARTINQVMRSGGTVMPYAGNVSRFTGWNTSAGGGTVDVGLFKVTPVDDTAGNLTPALLINAQTTASGNAKPNSWGVGANTSFAAGDMIFSAVKGGTSGKQWYFSGTLEVTWT